MKMERFGSVNKENITKLIIKSIPSNTLRTKKSVWTQFELFCCSRNYQISEDTTNLELANILQDWAVNMRKLNGEDYKDFSVKTIWNITAKMLQDKYFIEFGRSFNPFIDIEFKSARDARNAKRKLLQVEPKKRKQSSTSLERNEYIDIMNCCDEDTPEGLMKKFYHIASYELAWRGGEGVNCQIDFFKPETNNYGNETGRIEYNPIFSKTCQGGSQKCSDSKWLIQNKEQPERCPVRLFHKIMSKRGENITTSRFFLTSNPFWTKNGIWYKNSPVGRNELSKWLKKSAEQCGINVKNRKITNHSSRSTIVSHLAKAGVEEQQLIKITGHASASSIQPYLNIDSSHHTTIIEKIRKVPSSSGISASVTKTSTSTSTCSLAESKEEYSDEIIKKPYNVVYTNCVFNNCNFNK